MLNEKHKIGLEIDMIYFLSRLVPLGTLKILAEAILLLSAVLILSVSNGYAVDFYGADVSDADLPSSYMKVGLFGFRPVVGKIADDSPAAASGFQRGDVIFSVNGASVRNSNELGKFTTSAVSVTIFRLSEKKTLLIKKRDIGVGGSGTKLLTVEKQVVKQQVVVDDLAPATKFSLVVTEDSTSKDSQRHSISATPAAATKVSEMPTLTKLQETVGHNKQDIVLSGSHIKVNLPPTKLEKVAKPDCNDTSGKCAPRSVQAAVSSVRPASDLMERPIDHVQDKVVFENTKGDVTFSHFVHIRSLKKVQCLLCHKTDHPTPERIQARLDSHRAAHSFCRGCHQKSEKGPTTECHLCHSSKLKK